MVCALQGFFPVNRKEEKNLIFIFIPVFLSQQVSLADV